MKFTNRFAVLLLACICGAAFILTLCTQNANAVLVFIGTGKAGGRLHIDPTDPTKTQLRGDNVIRRYRNFIELQDGRVLINDTAYGPRVGSVLVVSADGSTVRPFAGAGSKIFDPADPTTGNLRDVRAMTELRDGRVLLGADGFILEVSSDGLSARIFRKGPHAIEIVERQNGRILISCDDVQQVFEASADGSTLKPFAGMKDGADRGDPFDPDDPLKTYLGYRIGSILELQDRTVLIAGPNRVFAITDDPISGKRRIRVFVGDGSQRHGDNLDLSDPTKTSIDGLGEIISLRDGRVFIPDEHRGRALLMPPDGFLIERTTSFPINRSDYIQVCSELRDGRMIAAVSGHNQVVVFGLDGSPAERFVGADRKGKNRGFTYEADSVPGSQLDCDPKKTKLDYPQFVLTLSDGRVLIYDNRNSRILCVTPGHIEEKAFSLVDKGIKALNKKAKTAKEIKTRRDTLDEVFRSLRRAGDREAMFGTDADFRRLLTQNEVDDGAGGKTWVVNSESRFVDMEVPLEVLQLIRHFTFQPARDRVPIFIAKRALKQLTEQQMQRGQLDAFLARAQVVLEAARASGNQATMGLLDSVIKRCSTSYTRVLEDERLQELAVELAIAEGGLSRGTSRQAPIVGPAGDLAVAREVALGGRKRARAVDDQAEDEVPKAPKKKRNRAVGPSISKQRGAQSQPSSSDPQAPHPHAPPVPSSHHLVPSSPSSLEEKVKEEESSDDYGEGSKDKAGRQPDGYSLKDAAEKLDISMAKLKQLIDAGFFPRAHLATSKLWSVPLQYIDRLFALVSPAQQNPGESPSDELAAEEQGEIEVKEEESSESPVDPADDAMDLDEPPTTEKKSTRRVRPQQNAGQIAPVPVAQPVGPYAFLAGRAVRQVDSPSLLPVPPGPSVAPSLPQLDSGGVAQLRRIFTDSKDDPAEVSRRVFKLASDYSGKEQYGRAKRVIIEAEAELEKRFSPQKQAKYYAEQLLEDVKLSLKTGTLRIAGQLKALVQRFAAAGASGSLTLGELRTLKMERDALLQRHRMLVPQISQALRTISGIFKANKNNLAKMDAVFLNLLDTCADQTDLREAIHINIKRMALQLGLLEKLLAAGARRKAQVARENDWGDLAARYHNLAERFTALGNKATPAQQKPLLDELGQINAEAAERGKAKRRLETPAAPADPNEGESPAGHLRRSRSPEVEIKQEPKFPT